MKPNLVLDTNILLLDANNLTILGKEYTIFLPETVLDEIDSKKSGTTEIAYQARAFGRLLTKATIMSTDKNVFGTDTVFQYEDTEIHIIALHTYPDISEIESNIRNDRKILHVATTVDKEYGGATFMSNDVMCRIRGISHGISTTDFKIIESVDKAFTKVLDLEYDIFTSLHNLPVLEADPEYTIASYNYVFTSKEYTNQTKLGNIRNGLIDILGKETEAELMRQDASPMNVGQKFLSRAIRNRNIDIVICEALAGF